MHSFVHLHVHSQYSILDGQAAVTKLVDKARADGMPGIALTDHGNMFGIKVFTDYVNSINSGTDKAIKQLRGQLDSVEGDERARLEAEIAAEQAKIFTPIIGCEMYVADGKLTEHEDKRDTGRHLVVLAKNLTGYHNLIKLVSKSWTDGYYYHPRTDKTELAKHREGLIVLSACLGGEIPRLIMQGRLDEARASVQWFKDTFGDDYYLELQRHKPNADVVNTDTYPNQVAVNNVLIEWSKEMGVKLVCTNDVHFVDEGDAEAHDRLICISTGTFLDEQNRMHYTKQEWMKTQSEMNEVFADVPEALDNTLEVISKVERYSIEHGPILPDFPLPEGFSDNDQYLRHLVYEGAKRRWGDELTDEQRERLDFELDTIKNMGFPGYFLIVQDFIAAARRLGVAVGPGRGSAAGSAVAYCLGITDIDPIKYDLLFERFLNPDRVNLPDIDTDFDDDGRKWVLKWVMDKYGHDNCAHIITYGAMKTKNSIKDVARVMKLPLATANEWCKAIPDNLPDGDKMNLGNAIKHTAVLKNAETSADAVESNTIKYARQLEGTNRNTGIHACGFIICANPISDWVPVSTGADPDFPDERTMLTQYDGHVIESTGLIKMDFLGLKTLSELKEAVKNVKLSRGIDIDIDTIPIDDELTYQLFQKGQTVGTFQFESAGMQKYLRMLHPTVFEDLIAMSALYRPGPMDYIPDFIKRKHNPSLITYDIPIMEKYLKDTYGITVYQEQVMLLSRLLANFTRGESDALRKAMGKKKKDIVDQMKPKFIEQGKANGHDPKVLEKIWSDWEKFASYAFNKSHATCYSWVAYQTGYMKAHYPAEFMAAIMTRRKSDIKEITKLMDECKSMGIATLGPDINESFADFGANKKGEIRFGLAAIKGVPTAAVDAVIKERTEHGPFKSIFDVLERIDLSSFNRKALECFAIAGALDCFADVPREAYFAENDRGQRFSEMLIRYAQDFHRSKFDSANSLFGDIEEIEMAKPEIPPYEPWSELYRLNQEKDLVGIYLSAHPLDKYYMEIAYGCNTPLAEMENRQADLGKEITFSGLVTAYDEKVNKFGKTYGKIVLEDYSGKYELMLFGHDYLNFNKYGKKGLALMVKAKYQQDPYSGKVRMQIADVLLLDDVKDKLLSKITITVPESRLEDLSPLNEWINDSTQNRCSLIFRVVTDDGKNYVDLISKYKLPLNKKVVEMLQSIDFQFVIS